MTTKELIEKLRELDPSGEMTVAGVDSFTPSPNYFNDGTIWRETYGDRNDIVLLY